VKIKKMFGKNKITTRKMEERTLKVRKPFLIQGDDL